MLINLTRFVYHNVKKQTQKTRISIFKLFGLMFYNTENLTKLSVVYNEACFLNSVPIFHH